MNAKIENIVGQNDAIELLTRLRLISSIKYRNGYLVARYGVNKESLKTATKKLDGIK